MFPNVACLIVLHMAGGKPYPVNIKINVDKGIDEATGRIVAGSGDAITGLAHGIGAAEKEAIACVLIFYRNLFGYYYIDDLKL